MVQSAAHQTLDLWILVRFRVPQPFLKEKDVSLKQIKNLIHVSFLLEASDSMREALLF